ncbi:prostaglandin E2 receptor EP4 subtype-like [Saccostrea cucullata]|uniref:prostaglandin E2 receptor EP4 subtype-like n=1 Tax=Saccostrea cuccullata TaxID=36930 RepID=UPI002ED2E755
MLLCSISVELFRWFSMNSSSPKYDYPICYRNDTQTQWVPAGLEYFFGITGNIIAFILLWINRREHQWFSFFKLFTGLVITDFMGIFLVYPFVMHRYATHFKWCYPKPLCQFTSFVFVDAHLSAALIICAMSVDRFMHLRNSVFITNRNYTLILIGIWILSSLISCLHLIGVGRSNMYFPGSWCYFDFIDDTTGNRVMAYLYSIIGFLIILGTLTINTLTMYRICRDPVQRGNLLDTSVVSGFYDSHVIIFISAVTVVFVFLWTPLVVDIFLHALNLRNNENNEIELWLLRLTVLNAIIDPWLYIVLRKESLRKIVEIYHKCRGSKELRSMNETDALLL